MVGLGVVVFIPIILLDVESPAVLSFRPGVADSSFEVAQRVTWSRE